MQAIESREEVFGKPISDTNKDPKITRLSPAPTTLFGSQSWVSATVPVQSVTVQRPEVAASQRAPPLPFTYLGTKIEDGNREVFLARGERTYVVHAGSTIDAIYQIEAIGNATLTLSYLPLKQMQVLQIGHVE